MSCIYQCKDTNFKANHNSNTVYGDVVVVVFTNAKILILKLITTDCWPSRFGKSCIYQCKDTNFKANHNLWLEIELRSIVVFTNAKILILKLITTISYNVLQSYSCIYQCKDTNFKANHNNWEKCQPNLDVVFTNAKILILKLITTSRTE